MKKENFNQERYLGLDFYITNVYNCESQYLYDGLAHTFKTFDKATISPLALRVAKTGLTIWEIFYIQRHFQENV